MRVHNGVTRTCSHAISPSSPRNAGTHNHGAALLKDAGAAGTPNNIFLWLWVPGRASLARDDKERVVVPFGPIRFSNSHALPRHRPAAALPVWRARRCEASSDDRALRLLTMRI